MNSELGKRVIADVVDACAALKKDMGRACQALVEARSGLASIAAGSCLVKMSSPSPAVYWGYDYSANGTWNTLHPCSTQRETLVGKYREISETYALDIKDARRPEELAGVQESCNPPGPSQVKTQQATVSGQTAAPAQPEVPVPLARMKESSLCEGTTIYMQIYDPGMREQVRQFRTWWQGNWHASVPPIEDVVATAFRAARPAPR
ncbi:MAG: hypothetical protein ACN6OX_00650, partial [Pseudomonas sp.]